MASIVSDANGTKRILFVDRNGKRRALYMGVRTNKWCISFVGKLDKLIVQADAGIMEEPIADWLADMGDDLHAKLAAQELVKPRERQRQTLGAFLTELFTTFNNLKPNTLRNYTQARACLESYFGKDRAMRSITPKDADKYRAWMAGEREKRLAPATVAKWTIIARQMFKQAVRWKLIAENPFADVKAGSQANRDRMYTVSREDAQKVIDACPDAEWRLLFALSRYGGMRCPSEHLALTWADVDWSAKLLRVRSSKTEHNEGGGERIVPIFPELMPYLEDVYDHLPEGAPADVITRYRDTRQNLRTQLCRIIRKAGLKVWPRPWHNLRATRQTELCERFPIHVVCEWLGNSRIVAQAHYLKVTDAHIAEAVGMVDNNRTTRRTAQTVAEHGELVGSGARESGDIPSQSATDHYLRASKRSRQESNL